MPLKKKWVSWEEFQNILQGGSWTPSPHTHIKTDITDTPWAWADVLKTGSNLTDLVTRQHAGLTDITDSQHHNKLHALTGAQHTASGLTIGWVIKATGAATFAWGQLPHDKLGGLGDDDHAQYLLASGARALTGNWDAGGYQIRALKFYSDQATGTAPFTVLSTTMVTNLNVDRWHGCGVSGLTIGHVLKATGAAAIAFQANNLGGLSGVNIQTPLQYQGLFYIDGEWVNRPEISYDMPYTSFKMYTDFFDKTQTPPWKGYSVNGGNIADVIGLTAHPGIARITSIAQANSGYRFQTGGSGAMYPILIGGKEMAEIVFKTKLVGARMWYYGYHNSNAPNTITNGAYFFVTTLGRLYGRTTSVGVGDASTGTYYQLSNNTWYRARLEVNSGATRVDFWLYSEAGQQLWTNYLTANIPTAAGKEVAHSLIAWYDGSAANDLLDVDMIAGYCSRPLARG